MEGKIYWFKPDFKTIADGGTTSVGMTSLLEIEITDGSIYFEFDYFEDNEQSYYEIDLEENENGLYSSQINSGGESYGRATFTLFESSNKIILEGEWNTTTDGNFRCLIEITNINPEPTELS